MNLISSVLKGIHDPDQPMHYGEVMALWTLLAAVQEGRTVCLTMRNHTDEPDLTRILERTVTDVQEPMARQLAEKLKDAGVPLPPLTADPPRANPTEVPPGARLMEEQVAQLMTAQLQGLLFMVHSGLLQSLREDLGAMFAKFQVQLLGDAYALKKSMADHGWLKVPPRHFGGRTPTRQQGPQS